MIDNVQFAKIQSTAKPLRSRASKTRDDALATGGITPAARLVQLRIAHGYWSAAQAARAIGVRPISYHHHECGRRGIGPKVAERYGKHFGVPAGFILYGNDPAVLQHDDRAGRLQVAVCEAEVIGAIIAHARIVSRAASQTLLPQTLVVPAFIAQPMQCLIVTDESMYPAYSYGDVVLFAPPQAPSFGNINGRECVVETEDGEWLLRVCHASADGTWTLTSHASRPRSGLRLTSAAPVLWVQRNSAQLPLM